MIHISDCLCVWMRMVDGLPLPWTKLISMILWSVIQCEKFSEITWMLKTGNVSLLFINQYRGQFLLWLISACTSAHTSSRGSIQIAFAATYPGSYLLCYFHSVCEHFLCLYQCFQIFLFYCNHYTTHPPDQVNHCLMVQLFMRAHDVRTLRILLEEKR